MRQFTRFRKVLAGFVALAAFGLTNVSAQTPSEIRLDYATYNPVSLLLKERGYLEEALAEDGIDVRWVQSHGSNRALEFLNAGSLDFGSTAGAAALIGRINGNPINAIYVYSQPEWTALVTQADSDIESVEDLAGKAVAVTRGTDPHIFLVRALASAGLTERDVRLVLLQHADGRLALERGDVQAWAGLDPMMAASGLESDARLFYRDADANSWGILNVRTAFAEEHPELVERVIAAYERAREEALADPETIQALFQEFTRLPANVVERQFERTDLTHSAIGDAQRETILQAGLALQEAGVIRGNVEVETHLDALIDTRFNPASTQ
ncbi:MAG: aliphatic sulfonate ABC transporter substrate-binding protein [Salinarimonas sp.]|nr:aliphatic sulfonate ABC transporter substrate-binding protein [Salinarimonas sp.]